MDNFNPQEDNNIELSPNQDKNNKNLCYIYKHIRLDTNEVFYIGKGTNTKGTYIRSKSKDRSNQYWHNIVNKHGYKIEIVVDNLTESEANEKEIELIKLYGRKDLGVGTLVNMSDGGDGMNNMSEEIKLKISSSNMGKKCANPQNKDPEKIRKMAEKHRGMKRSEEAKKRMSDAKKGKPAHGRKLLETDIRKIREDYINNVIVNQISDYGRPLEYKSAFCIEYGKLFSVSVPCIRNIIDGKTYMEII